MYKKDFIFSLKELKSYLRYKKLELTKVSLPSFEDSHNEFRLLIPKYYVNLIDWYDPKDPLRKMVLPDKLEKQIKKYELSDPIGDKVHTPVQGVIHRHKDRCLLNLTNNCAMHCRFCFRRNLLDDRNPIDTKECIDYIQKHEEIWEVILSGGDPFTLTDHFLSEIISSLRKIKHVKMIRFHTRTPVVYPKRVSGKFIKILKHAFPCTIVFHINHPQEITPQFISAVKKLNKNILLSQTVFMKDVNDNAQTLDELFRKLTEIGIKPYYLHHLDLTRGTDHFRASIEKGSKIMKYLKENMSGICLPEYVVDLPGGTAKIQILSLNSGRKRRYSALNSQGKNVTYTDYFSS